MEEEVVEELVVLDEVVLLEVVDDELVVLEEVVLLDVVLDEVVEDEVVELLDEEEPSSGISNSVHAQNTYAFAVQEPDTRILKLV